MAIFTSKRTQVEAVQVLGPDFNGRTFDGPPLTEAPSWIEEAVRCGRLRPVQRGTDYATWLVQTPEGDQTAGPSDWIVRDAKGDLRPCNPDVFRSTYDSFNPNEIEVQTKRGVLAIEVGDENWEPTQEEMREVSDLFLSADLDPLGAVICVRTGVVLKSFGGEPVLRVPVIAAGSPDWEPTSEQMRDIVERITVLNRPYLEERLRKALMTSCVSESEFDQIVAVFFGDEK